MFISNIDDTDIMGINHNLIKAVGSASILGAVNGCLD